MVTPVTALISSCGLLVLVSFFMTVDGGGCIPANIHLDGYLRRKAFAKNRAMYIMTLLRDWILAMALLDDITS